MSLNLPQRLTRIVASLCLLTFIAAAGLNSVSAQTNYGEIAFRVATMLEEEHYLRKDFDDEMSERVLQNYLEFLDFSRVYFTQEDIELFRDNYLTTLDDSVRNKDIQPAFDIYAIYKERVQSRVDQVKKLLKEEKFTFDSDRVLHLSRKELEWPKNEAEAEKLWYALVEGDMLQEEMAKDAKKDDDEIEVEKKIKEEPQTAEEKINKRYARILDTVVENQTEDIAVIFIKSIARSYDPHSEYFSQAQYDNFKIGMSKSLTGIGAMLREEEDGSASIQGLVVGGPAFKNGQLAVGDRVIGVAQGDDGEMIDVIPIKLDKIVEKIRGQKGTTVSLKVIPADAADPSETKVVQIVRDKVDLKDSLATADLILTKDPETGKDQKIGWINLLSFYSDMDGGNTSTTVDVQRLLTRLMAEGIDGLVVDLRDNGGGSLEEAVNMTGLFIPRGPVVQSQDWRGMKNYKASRNRDAIYKGPMIVLNNRASASASEIFAAALQDYRRAVIVGEKASFGKGTVQQLRPVFTNRLVLPFNRNQNQNGALKLTIQTFFRINGYSTQLDGVIPDVRLPSTNDVLDIGEEALPFALKAEPIEPSIFEPVSREGVPAEQLQIATDARIASDQAFKYVIEDVERNETRIDENTISLNREQRETETKEFEVRRDARKEERIKRFAEVREAEKDLFTVYMLTQDNFNDPDMVLKNDLTDEQLSGMTSGKKEEDPDIEALKYPHGFDPYKRETLHILQDLISITRTGKPVNISKTVAERSSRPILKEDAKKLEKAAN